MTTATIDTKLVASLIALAKKPSSTTRDCDEAAKPLIQQLLEKGVISSDFAHVEWSGAIEHDVLAVFWFDSEKAIFDPTMQSHCLNVNADGSIDVCA